MSFDGSLARRVLAGAGGEHLAHDDFADGGRVDAGFRQQLADDLRAEFGGRNLGERPAEFADRGTARGYDDDVFHYSLQFWLSQVCLAAIRSICSVAVVNVHPGTMHGCRFRPGGNLGW
jgi:hypothetical protein